MPKLFARTAAVTAGLALAAGMTAGASAPAQAVRHAPEAATRSAAATSQVGQVAHIQLTSAAMSPASSRQARAVAFAKRQLGKRYVWGAAGPRAYDCSGLTMAAWRHAGVRLPHNAAAQFRRGKAVSKRNLRPGDLVFYYRGIRHVAIYIGHGKIVQASRPGRPINIASVNSMPYMGARRVG